MNISESIFTTRSFALAHNLSFSSASRKLKSLAQAQQIVKVTRGLWANPQQGDFHPLAVTPFLLGAEQGYVSFLTALHACGAISQIPTRYQIATTGHGRILKTELGVFEFFHLAPQMMRDGIDWSTGHIPYRVANFEKAFLDVCYLATRKKRRFASLPELDFAVKAGFNQKKFAAYLAAQVPSLRLQTAIKRRLSLCD